MSDNKAIKVETVPSGSDERKFLHDMATPLTIACLSVESVLDSLQTTLNAESIELKQLTRTFNSLEKLKKLIQERREILIQRGVPGSNG